MLNMYIVRTMGMEVGASRRNAPNFNKEGEMDRHSFMLKKHSEKCANEKKAFEMWKARGEVEVNGNGTSGYVVKHGSNKGKILGHNSTKANNNW